MTWRRSIMVLVALAGMWGLGGCQKPVTTQPDYSRPLPPGAVGFRLVPPERWPDLKPAVATRNDALLAAADRSVEWFSKPSTRQFFPLGGISHEQAHASVFAFARLAREAASAMHLEQEIVRQFDLYESIGWDGSGTVLFTGYYSPQFPASRTPSAEYRYPLYKRPADLVTEPATGKVLGRRVDGEGLAPYPTRRQIESSNQLAGQELVWLKDKLDAYIIHVQGSAKLVMTDSSVLFVGFAGTNGHPYTPISKRLIAEGKLTRDQAGLAGIRAYFQGNPQDLDRYIQENDRFTFFTEYPGGNWPAGSLGVKVTPWRSLATDKEVFPRGSVVLVDTNVFPGSGMARRFQLFMLDQDTGGAIRAAGRADIYMGEGDLAGQIAGRQMAEGKLYYLILKPDRVAYWQQQLRMSRTGAQTH